MGKKNGRICLLYQIDIDEDELTYSSRTKQKNIQGTVSSEGEFFNAISKLLEIHISDRIELALRLFKHQPSMLMGICAKSLPRTQLTNNLLNKIHVCLGGFNGDELVHLPFPGGLFDQPNIFVEAYYIYRDELAKHRKFKEGTKPK